MPNPTASIETSQGTIEVELFAEDAVSYTQPRAPETPEHLVCRLLLEKKQ